MVQFSHRHKNLENWATEILTRASASCNSTLYLEGYADGQQHHYAVWAARALRERDVQLHGRAAVRHHGSQWRGQVHVYEDFDGGAGFHKRLGYTAQENGGFAAGPVCLRRLSRH